jgi:predicted DNA-binding protein with PD1-like motif
MQSWVSNVHALPIRLKPGDDLRNSILRYASLRKLEAGCILTCVGSLKEATLRFAGMSYAIFLSG